MTHVLNNEPTGDVFIRNFDEGIVKTLGAVARIDTLPSLNRRINGYWLDETFTDPTAVPVIFNNPEQIFEHKIYPSYHVARSNIEPALHRWHSVKQLEYIAGVSGTETVVDGVSGFTSVETKAQAWPVDIYYAISCYARYEHEAVPMAKRILSVYKPYSKIELTDSLGESRSYTVFAETGLQDIGEVVSVADRLKAYSLDLRVEAELDLQDPITRSTVDSVVNRLGTL